MMLVMVNESKKKEESRDLEKVEQKGPFTGKKRRQMNGEEWEGGSWVSAMVGPRLGLDVGLDLFSISFSSSFILLFFWAFGLLGFRQLIQFIFSVFHHFFAIFRIYFITYKIK